MLKNQNLSLCSQERDHDKHLKNIKSCKPKTKKQNQNFICEELPTESNENKWYALILLNNKLLIIVISVVFI